MVKANDCKSFEYSRRWFESNSLQKIMTSKSISQYVFEIENIWYHPINCLNLNFIEKKYCERKVKRIF